MDQGIFPTPPSATAVEEPGRTTLRRARSLGVTALCLLGGALAGAAASPGHAAANGDASLTQLLRLMALLKLATVLGAAWLVDWRLHRPAELRFRFGYPAALGLMAAAPGLIWWAAPVAVGAVAFHAGLVLLLVLAFGDDGVVTGWHGKARGRFTPN